MDYYEYINTVIETNKFTNDDINPLLFGLFGEIGGVLTVSKKRHREGADYIKFSSDLCEEAGDALWYFVSICMRHGLTKKQITNHFKLTAIEKAPSLDKALLSLSASTCKLIDKASNNDDLADAEEHCFRDYLLVLNVENIPLDKVMELNYLKIIGRFRSPKYEDLETFDMGFDKDERLPEYFEVTISEKASGRSYLKWNDVFIGDPLTDSIKDKDGYRFHDVFHLANAAILHWSPTFRGLIKHKRKSCSEIEEAEDSGRAIVVEEGLSAWLFSYAKTEEVNFFEDQKVLPFDVLKTLQQFIRGYEVQKCPLFLWEKAILDGYRVFRQVKLNNGGIVIGNRKTRTIEYKAID